MMKLLAALEAAGVSTWLRETSSPLGFQVPLVLHVLGMGVLAGLNAGVALRLLGLAGGIPLVSLRRLYPVLWSAFAVAALSGLVLLLAYPAKALTNPVFYAKLALIAAALSTMSLIGGRVLVEGPPGPPSARWLGALSLGLWAAVIVAARLLPYTYSYLFAGVRAAS